ncbi:hypothetical protein [Legionella sp.]|uniref:hypothetical protein n=1 Tax=Legionella sp. TaxID=459 RepID=UPI003CB53B5C
MLLITTSSRMLGYAETTHLQYYPFSPLSEKIRANRPQEKEKLENIIGLLRTIFYLIYQYCTVEQLEKDFVTSNNQSYKAIQDFSNTITRQMHTLTKREAILVHRAHYLFCLNQYIK